ncbi:unnamed protein product [Malus baccata var. baccata]
MSCIIGYLTSHDMWTTLKDRFSTVTKASIFQLKTELQNIKKGSDSVSQYFQRIKDVRDHLSAAGVFFEDDDIVILALKGLPVEYNTFRTVIRGRDNVISLKDFRSQLLAEEAVVENTSVSDSFVSAMMANDTKGKGKALMLGEGSTQTQSKPYSPTGSNNAGSYIGGSSNNNGGYSFNHRGRGRGRNYYNSTPRFHSGFSNSGAGILGPGKPHCYHRSDFSHQGRAPSSTLSAMHTTYQRSAPSDQFWVADTGATSHMTSDLANLNFATPFSGSDTVTTASGSASPSSTQSQIPIDPDFQIEQLPVVLPLPSVSLHPMQTRSKSGISKRKVFTATV